MTDAEKKLLQAKHRMGGSPGARSSERTKSPDTAADPGRCDFRKSDARGAGDGVVRPRKLSLAKAVTILFYTMEGLRETGGFPFCTRRAHLFTTC